MQPFVQGKLRQSITFPRSGKFVTGKGMPMVGRDFTIVPWPYHMRCIAASASEQAIDSES
jgi:hypothetical protein